MNLRLVVERYLLRTDQAPLYCQALDDPTATLALVNLALALDLMAWMKCNRDRLPKPRRPISKLNARRFADRFDLYIRTITNPYQEVTNHVRN